MTIDTNTRIPLLAGVLWIVAGVGWIVAEAITAAAYPGYSYATNYISDLGVPGGGEVAGRVMNSPLHAVMNAAFIGQGLLFALAAVLAARTCRVGPWRTIIALALIHGAGAVLVGLVHGSPANAANGLMTLHGLGAAMAIIPANVIAIVVGARSTVIGAPVGYRIVSVALGIVGLLSLVMLEVDSASAELNIFPDGVWERASVYSWIAWELLTGAALLVGHRRWVRTSLAA